MLRDCMAYPVTVTIPRFSDTVKRNGKFGGPKWCELSEQIPALSSIVYRYSNRHAHPFRISNASTSER
jgi:hypothetical protein